MAAKAKQRPARKVIQDARKALELPAIAAPAFPALADEVNAQIERIYQDALNSVEIALLLRQREREDEDDEEILLLI